MPVTAGILYRQLLSLAPAGSGLHEQAKMELLKLQRTLILLSIMARLADGFIHELKERIDLFDLISPYVQLKKSGASWVGLSPFQQEKNPIFYVHPQKGFLNALVRGKPAMLYPLFKR